MSLNLTIKQGKTFSETFRWGTSPILFKAISAITQTAPVQLTVTGHGIPDGWMVTVVSVKNMVEINADHDPPWVEDYRKVSVLDANTIKFPDVDASLFTPYTSGGYVRLHTPIDLAGWTARMTIKNRVGGTVLATFVSPADIVLDNTAKTITLTISAAVTAAYTWTRGVYDFELVNGAIVKELASGIITITREVTT